MEKATFAVGLLCDVLQVTRSGYYAWTKAKPSARARQCERLKAEIRAIHSEHRERYGSPRVHAELQARGHRVGRKRVERLMREDGLKCRPKRRFKRTTERAAHHPVAPNVLERNFNTARPDAGWVGDITYIWTAEGWAYLAVLLDLYSRRVVGWALRSSLDRELALAALDQALMRRSPAPGLVHHTDRGSQYTSAEYRERLRAHGIDASMSRVGDCWDNAVAESFFATLKKELVHGCAFQTRTEAYDAIADYIENYYNAVRRHSAIGYRTPVEMELTHSLPQAA